jgi:hypothetical protein
VTGQKAGVFFILSYEYPVVVSSDMRAVGPVAGAVRRDIRFEIWPLFQHAAVDALVVLPMGIVVAIAFEVLRARASKPDQKDAVTLGYAAAAPVAYFASLIEGLVMPPAVGAVILGAGVLIAGMLIALALSNQRRQ